MSIKRLSQTLFLGLPLIIACADGGGDPNANVAWNEAFESEVLELVNERRAEGATCGSEVFEPTTPLTMEPRLLQAARYHTKDMVDRDFFSHTNPDGKSPGDRITATGYVWGTYGENISIGRSSPEAVMDGWMQSPGHCANIMNPAFVHFGIGHYETRWTQVFGAPR